MEPPSRAAYDSVVDYYDRFAQGPMFTEFLLPALAELVPNDGQQVVLDLSCGQGVVTRYLAEMGMAVTGVDLSAGQLERAKRYDDVEPMAIVYLQGDAQRLSMLSDGQFDGVVCSMALMDIPDMNAVYAEVHRVLRPGGWFVGVITHPCFQTPRAVFRERPDGRVSREVMAYWDEGHWRPQEGDGLRARVGAQHRTLATYLNGLIAAGFAIERILEPQATGAFAEEEPGYAEVPEVLLWWAHRIP